MSMIIHPILARCNKTQWRTTVNDICPIFSEKEQLLVKIIVINIVDDPRCTIVRVLSLPFGSISTFKRLGLSIKKVNYLLKCTL